MSKAFYFKPLFQKLLFRARGWFGTKAEIFFCAPRSRNIRLGSSTSGKDVVAFISRCCYSRSARSSTSAAGTVRHTLPAKCWLDFRCWELETAVNNWCLFHAGAALLATAAWAPDSATDSAPVLPPSRLRSEAHFIKRGQTLILACWWCKWKQPFLNSCRDGPSHQIIKRLRLIKKIRGCSLSIWRTGLSAVADKWNELLIFRHMQRRVFFFLSFFSQAAKRAATSAAWKEESCKLSSKAASRCSVHFYNTGTATRNATNIKKKVWKICGICCNTPLQRRRSFRGLKGSEWNFFSFFLT